MFYLLRLIRICIILSKYRLDRIVSSFPLLAPIRLLLFLYPGYWFANKRFKRGEAIRYALLDLGPIFVKFGQALSTRPDLFPKDVIEQLALLQDRVPPFPNTQAKSIVEQELKQPLTQLFTHFSVEPLASASIAQVHAATLLDGREVVVKILRPNSLKTIQRDIRLLYMVAASVQCFWRDAKRLRLKEVVAEFERTILAELDLLREAANASQLRRNFMGSDLLYVPEIYWPYSRKKVMVMEKIHAIPINNIRELQANNIDMRKLAECGVEIFFTQVFRDRFFHADMHPGNIFVSRLSPEQPQYVCVDFGIMGTLNDNDKHYLASNLLAFFNRDYHLIAQLHVESGWVPRNTRIEEFEGAIRTVCEPIFARPLKEISCAQLIMRLFQIGRHFNMTIQPQLILLQKTLFAVEGLGRQLYPELDLWQTAKPLLERNFKEQMNFKSFWQRVQLDGSSWAQRIPEMPNLIYDALRQIKQGTLTVSTEVHDRALRQRKERKRGFFIGFGYACIGLVALVQRYELTVPLLLVWLVLPLWWFNREK